MKKFLLFIIFMFSCSMDAQNITSVSPNTGNAGETLDVTITGDDDTMFVSISDTEGVTFYNNFSQSLLVNSYTLLSGSVVVANVTIPYYSQGDFDVSVNAMFQQYNLANAFSVINTYNTISGVIKIDNNGNGCDASDTSMSGIRVDLSDGINESYTFTNASSEYLFYVPAGNYTVTPQPEMPYFTITPVSATINFATQANLTETLDFCIAPDGVHNDLSISILPLEPARPGFNATYRIVYENNGNQTLNGTVNVMFEDAVLDFVSASVAPTSQTFDNLNWNYSNLLPFESRWIDFTLNVNSPMETPPVNINDILDFIATANPVAGDDTPENNSIEFAQTVVGSYDPNDKAVAEGSQINISEVDEYLHYLIRFQNSGTFAAENVVVKDMLPSNLDPSTLEVISASHPYRTTLTDGNKLEFFFENINLPAEMNDEPGSHGFVAFKIKPTADVGIGSTMENTAEIFFDFNFPIITNTVATTVTALGTNSFNFEKGVMIYPNPVNDVLNVVFELESGSAFVKIFNQLGQLVKSAGEINENQNTIAVGDLNSGTYFIQFSTNDGTIVKKLIKL